MDTITTMFQWLLIFYCAVFALSLLSSFLSYKKINKRMDNYSHGQAFAALYVVRKKLFWDCLLWPVRFPPHYMLSQLFFSQYGDPNRFYFRAQGLKNFLNDLFRGKNRYAKYTIHSKTVKLEKNSDYYRKSGSAYVFIIYGKYKTKYLLRIGMSNQKSHPEEISRYHLDECQVLTEDVFVNKLKEINHDLAEEILTEINSL